MNKVLIADDDNSTRELIGLIVGQFLNCKYDIAENILQAVIKTVSNDYKLIIINIHMQGINGNKIIENLIKLSPKATIIAITNTEDTELMNSILKSGACKILNKPFSINQMLDATMQFI